MKTTEIEFDDLRAMYRKVSKQQGDSNKARIRSALMPSLRAFAADNAHRTAEELFERIDELEGRIESLSEDQLGFPDFDDDTVFHLGKGRRVHKSQMTVEYWEIKRRSLADNRDRAIASADIRIAICDRHIDELSGVKV